MFNATLTRADGALLHTPLDVRPVRFSAAALGGPETAELAVSGDKNALSDVLAWLTTRVVIHNSSALPVWWGLVQAVAVTIDGVEYGLDASEIINRMAILYTDEAGEAAQTIWVEDAHSISLYGTREVRESIRANSTTAAVAQATRYINERSAPLRSVRAASGPDGAKIYAVGYWRTLDWRYWSQEAGQELRDEDGNATELVGFSVAGTDIGFFRSHRVVGRLTADLYPLLPGDRIKVSGSSANDGAYEVEAGDDRTSQTTWTTTTIEFDPADDLLSSTDGLDAFREYDLISIAGSDDNDGNYFIKEILDNGEHVTVAPGTIVAEPAGDTVTVTAGNQLKLTAKPVATEYPGATTTLASQAVKVAQAVTITAATAWELSEIWLQAARIGTPADNLKIEVCADSAGAPGTVLKSATLTGAGLPLLEAMDWQQWTFDSLQSLSAGTMYWIVVSRTGSAGADGYRVGMLEAEEGLSSDNLLLWDGSAWVSRTVASGLAARLSLRMYGQRVTTSQIENIVSGVGDWLAATIRTASGLRSRLYRSAEEAQTAQSEIRALLDLGTSGNQRLLARVSTDRILFVDAAPAATAPRYIWTADGLRDRWGQPLPDGELPVGEWVLLELAGATEAFGPAFLEAAEYDVATASIRPSFRAERPIQTLARIAKPPGVPDLATQLGPYLRSSAVGVQRIEITNLIRTSRKTLVGPGGGSSGGEGIEDPDDILAALLTVDGTGSGLDADLLDGNEASAFILNSLLTTRGDIIRRGASAPERYALSVPASPTLSYLGVANGEVDPSWKSASSNPGAAAGILQSNASGQLQLVGLIAGYVRPAADSTTALQLQNAAGTAILTVDTTNGRVGINVTPTDQLQVLAKTPTQCGVLINNNSDNTIDPTLTLYHNASIQARVIYDSSVGRLTIQNYFDNSAGHIYINTRGANTRLFVSGDGNIGLNQTTFGTSAVKVLCIGNGTAPSTSPADAVQLWSDDYAAGDAGLHLRTESGAVYKFASVADIPALIVNESGAATGDLRAESDTEANMLFLDASADTLQLGGTTNSINIAKGGHLTLLGTARVWDDIRVEPVVRSSGSNVPSFSQWFTNGAGSRGVYLYTFGNEVDAGEKEVHFTIQLPHAWAQTAIHLHVHWLAATTAASSKVRWGLEYTWAEPLAAFGNTTLVYATDPEGGDTGTTQYKHMITEFAALTPTSSQDGLSSILICRLWRDSSDAADTYTGDVGLLYIDAHVELDKLGSNDEYA